MENELDNLYIDLKSDKPQKRGKAFSRFNHLLSNKLKEVQDVIENSDSTSWNEFYKAVHQGLHVKFLYWILFNKSLVTGLVYQADKLFKADIKIDEYHKDIKWYSEAIIQVTQSASNGKKMIFSINNVFLHLLFLEFNGVSFMQIAKNAIQVFSEEGLIRYFGKTYVILLQKTVRNSKNNLTEITTMTWKRKMFILIKYNDF